MEDVRDSNDVYMWSWRIAPAALTLPGTFLSSKEESAEREEALENLVPKQILRIQEWLEEKRCDEIKKHFGLRFRVPPWSS